MTKVGRPKRELFPETKKCTKCKRVLPLTTEYFYFRVKRNCYESHCKECAKIIKKAYYKKNRQTLLEKAEEYRDLHGERINFNRRRDRHKYEDTNNKYLEKKKDHLNAKRRENKKKRFANDIPFKLRHLFSGIIRVALKKHDTTKNNSSYLDYLVYTIDELKIHLESLFEPWMTWANHGKYDKKKWKDDDQSTWVWQIDHIIPQSDLPYTSMEDENFKRCWALINLRPYSAKQNAIDGAIRERHQKK